MPSSATTSTKSVMKEWREEREFEAAAMQESEL